MGNGDNLEPFDELEVGRVHREEGEVLGQSDRGDERVVRTRCGSAACSAETGGDGPEAAGRGRIEGKRVERGLGQLQVRLADTSLDGIIGQ